MRQSPEFHLFCLALRRPQRPADIRTYSRVRSNSASSTGGADSVWAKMPLMPHMAGAGGR